KPKGSTFVHSAECDAISILVILILLQIFSSPSRGPRQAGLEMEGAEAAAAIDQAGRQGIPTRFMMIRGISDLPRAEGKNNGRKERDAWKAYASDASTAFVMGWIAEGLPMPPSDKMPN